MIPFDVISAAYGNEEQTLVVVRTEQRGTMLLTQTGMPEEWEFFHSLGLSVGPFETTVPSFKPLTARQLRLGLVNNGFAMAQVEAAIAAIDDLHQRSVAQIEWEYASQFERGHPLIAQVGAALGLTDTQIDGMWEQALSA